MKNGWVRFGKNEFTLSSGIDGHALQKFQNDPIIRMFLFLLNHSHTNTNLFLIDGKFSKKKHDNTMVNWPAGLCNNSCRLEFWILFNSILYNIFCFVRKAFTDRYLFCGMGTRKRERKNKQSWVFFHEHTKYKCGAGSMWEEYKKISIF